ncbi:hypothetical protein SEPCBS57363_005450 [Sporothrix epigloea]|uniref:Uncharacterized protein n=1 Tax=Sporothrix epigloea TaxID=1892477 RepID=A0ABP0DXL8_9PEZI
MTAVDNSGLVELYLASIWRYHCAGIERVLQALRNGHPRGQYTFEEESGCFKPIAGNEWISPPSFGNLPKEPANKAAVDQQLPAAFEAFAFRKVWTRVKTEMPDAISVHKLLSEDDRQYITAVTGAHIIIDTVSARLVYIGAGTKIAVAKTIKMLDNLFSRFIFTMPPPKHMLYAETDGAYHVDARYVAHVNDVMLTSTILDPSQYPTEVLLDKMFKFLFAKSVCLRICDVDHFKRMEISVFGPRSQPIFNNQARKWPTWFKRAEYTPKSCEITEFKVIEDAVADSLKVSATQRQAQLQSQPQFSHQENKPVNVISAEANGVESNQATDLQCKSVGSVDLLGLDLPDASEDCRSTTASVVVSSEDELSSPSMMSPIPSLYQSDKYGYQMRLLWDFVNSPSKISRDLFAADQVKLTEIRSTMDNGTGVSDSNIETRSEPKSQDKAAKSGRVVGVADLIDCFDDSPAQPAAAAPQAVPNPSQASVASSTPPTYEYDNVLIEIDSSPSRPISPCLTRTKQEDSTALEKDKNHTATISPQSQMSKALLVRRSPFTNNLCNALRRLMADLPYSRGRIRMQVELGRVYIMDAGPEGLAFNMPGEAATGWSQSEITTRLDTICVSPESIVFSRALTLFANDIESVLGLDDHTIARNLSDNWSGSILDRNGVESRSGLSPNWAFHEKRVLYEFKCQRLYLKSNAIVKASSPFIVEVDGTGPGPFTYSIRSVEDTRPPIWLHCIRRHWDARVSVSYSQTDNLEAEYGDFARELLRSMVVPPGPITSPKFQFFYDHREAMRDGKSYSTTVLSARIRNIGRFVSADQQSFLDVSWNWLMKLAMRPGKEGPLAGTVHATPAPDSPTKGVFTSWYEASVVSVAAEAAFQENETLPVGGMASWGAMGTAALDEMYESAFRPALQLVQDMDGVGVLVDNGQGDRQWTPPVKASQVALAVQKFW